jgi:hypothetical protein
MNASRTYVFVLEPDTAYSQWVWSCKRRMHELVGDQLYLDHPPHITLYVSVFPPQAALCDRVARLAERILAPQTVMDQWHVFQADQLTGNHTLVCDVPEASRAMLRQIQTQVVGAVSPLREVAASRAQYDGSWERLSPDERANVERFGFPFVGAIWRAHVTIASIRPQDWPLIESVLQEQPPATPVCFTHLAIHVLEGDAMPLVERFALRGTSALPSPGGRQVQPEERTA